MVQLSAVETLERQEEIVGDTLDPQLAQEVEALIEGENDPLEIKHELIEVRDATGHWYVTMPTPGVRYYTF